MIPLLDASTLTLPLSGTFKQLLLAQQLVLSTGWRFQVLPLADNNFCNRTLLLLQLLTVDFTAHF